MRLFVPASGSGVAKGGRPARPRRQVLGDFGRDPSAPARAPQVWETKRKRSSGLRAGSGRGRSPAERRAGRTRSSRRRRRARVALTPAPQPGGRRNRRGRQTAAQAESPWPEDGDAAARRLLSVEVAAAGPSVRAAQLAWPTSKYHQHRPGRLYRTVVERSPEDGDRGEPPPPARARRGGPPRARDADRGRAGEIRASARAGRPVVTRGLVGRRAPSG